MMYCAFPNEPLQVRNCKEKPLPIGTKPHSAAMKCGPSYKEASPWVRFRSQTRQS